MVYGSASSQETPAFAAAVPAAVQQAAQQAAEYERLNQVHRLRRQESSAHDIMGATASTVHQSTTAPETTRAPTRQLKVPTLWHYLFPRSSLPRMCFVSNATVHCIRLLLPNVSFAKRVDLFLVCPCRVLTHALKKRCKTLRIKIVKCLIEGGTNYYI